MGRGGGGAEREVRSHGEERPETKSAREGLDETTMAREIENREWGAGNWNGDWWAVALQGEGFSSPLVSGFAKGPKVQKTKTPKPIYAVFAI
ncbi:unnamed protein product [Linum trigynum]|uniref:Uncharacterized protein n=1 Tax=Linum trigynum TaxID=586398 RepID=A0AAV2DKR4_9ROSI